MSRRHLAAVLRYPSRHRASTEPARLRVAGLLLALGVALAGGGATAGGPPGPAGPLRAPAESTASSPSTTASAEPSSPPAESSGEADGEDPRGSAGEAQDNKAKAQQLLAEGNRLASEGDFGTALQRFRSAYELYPSAKLLLNIGTSLRHTGQNAEAAQTYERYLAHPDADPRRVDELRRVLDEIDQVVGRLQIEIQPAGATLRVDGKLISYHGKSHLMRVDPGEHTVVVEKPGFVTAVRTVQVQRRALVRVPVALGKPGVPPPVIVEKGHGDTQRMVGYIIGGVGVAALAAGAVFGGVALSTDAEADEHCLQDDPSICDPEGVDLGDSAQTQATLSTVFLIGGGALLATGLVVWLTAPSDDETEPSERPATTAALALSPGPGVSLSMTW